MNNIQKSVVKIKKSVDGQQEMLEAIHGQLAEGRTSHDSHVMKEMMKSFMDFVESKSKDSMKEMKASSISIKKEVTQTSGNLRSDLASIANEVHEVKSWKDAMTPVLKEILNKTKIAVYSNTHIAEDLAMQKNHEKVHTRRVQDIKDSVRNIELTVNSQLTLSDVLSRDEAMDEFDEIKNIIHEQGDLPEVLDKNDTLAKLDEIKDLVQQQTTFDDAKRNASSVTSHKSEFLCGQTLRLVTFFFLIFL